MSNEQVQSTLAVTGAVVVHVLDTVANILGGVLPLIAH